MKEQSIQAACSIIAANATGRGFSTEQLTEQISQLAGIINSLYFGPVSEVEVPAVADVSIKADWKSSIAKTFITCLICGHACKVLAPHLRTQHNLTTKEYRAQFNIPRTVSLISKDARARRQQLAKDRNLGDVLRHARESKVAI